MTRAVFQLCPEGILRARNALGMPVLAIKNHANSNLGGGGNRGTF